jgi:hypothetical protein
MITQSKSFTQDGKIYILFQCDSSPHDFLYFSHLVKPLRSLFFGSGLAQKVAAAREMRQSCIECHIGTGFEGGISLDGTDLVELNYTKNQANTLIAELKTRHPTLPIENF